MLPDRCPVCPVLSCPVLSVCNVGALWPNGWMDQDATWYGGRPRPRPQCVRWDPAVQLPPRKGAQQLPPALFGPCLLWPNGCLSQQLLSSCVFFFISVERLLSQRVAAQTMQHAARSRAVPEPTSFTTNPTTNPTACASEVWHTNLTKTDEIAR